jgi:hypothetical protein
MDTRSSQVVIGDVPVVGMDSTTYHVWEGETVSVILNRVGDLTRESTVDYSLTHGDGVVDDDYSISPGAPSAGGTATFAVGASTTVINVSPSGDGLFNETADENLTLTLDCGSNAQLNTNLTSVVAMGDVPIVVMDLPLRVGNHTALEGETVYVKLLRYGDLSRKSRVTYTVLDGTYSYTGLDGAIYHGAILRDSATGDYDVKHIDGTAEFDVGVNETVVEVYTIPDGISCSYSHEVLAEPPWCNGTYIDKNKFVRDEDDEKEFIVQNCTLADDNTTCDRDSQRIEHPENCSFFPVIDPVPAKCVRQDFFGRTQKALGCVRPYHTSNYHIDLLPSTPTWCSEPRGVRCEVDDLAHEGYFRGPAVYACTDSDAPAETLQVFLTSTESFDTPRAGVGSGENAQINRRGVEENATLLQILDVPTIEIVAAYDAEEGDTVTVEVYRHGDLSRQSIVWFQVVPITATPNVDNITNITANPTVRESAQGTCDGAEWFGTDMECEATAGTCAGEAPEIAEGTCDGAAWTGAQTECEETAGSCAGEAPEIAEGTCDGAAWTGTQAECEATAGTCAGEAPEIAEGMCDGAAWTGTQAECEETVGTCAGADPDVPGTTTKALCDAAVTTVGTFTTSATYISTLTTKALCDAAATTAGTFTARATYVSTPTTKALCDAAPTTMCDGAVWTGTQTECEETAGTCASADPDVPGATTKALCDAAVTTAGMFTTSAAYVSTPATFTTSATYVSTPTTKALCHNATVNGTFTTSATYVSTPTTSGVEPINITCPFQGLGPKRLGAKADRSCVPLIDLPRSPNDDYIDYIANYPNRTFDNCSAVDVKGCRSEEDYSTISSGSLVFLPGVRNQTIEVKLVDDEKLEKGTCWRSRCPEKIEVRLFGSVRDDPPELAAEHAAYAHPPHGTQPGEFSMESNMELTLERVAYISVKDMTEFPFTEHFATSILAPMTMEHFITAAQADTPDAIVAVNRFEQRVESDFVMEGSILSFDTSTMTGKVRTAQMQIALSRICGGCVPPRAVAITVAQARAPSGRRRLQETLSVYYTIDSPHDVSENFIDPPGSPGRFASRLVNNLVAISKDATAMAAVAGVSTREAVLWPLRNRVAGVVANPEPDFTTTVEYTLRSIIHIEEDIRAIMTDPSMILAALEVLRPGVVVDEDAVKLGYYRPVAEEPTLVENLSPVSIVLGILIGVLIAAGTFIVFQKYHKAASHQLVIKEDPLPPTPTDPSLSDVTRGGALLLGNGVDFETLVVRGPAASARAELTYQHTDIAAFYGAQVKALGRFLRQYEANAAAGDGGGLEGAGGRGRSGLVVEAFANLEAGAQALSTPPLCLVTIVVAKGGAHLVGAQASRGSRIRRACPCSRRSRRAKSTTRRLPGPSSRTISINMDRCTLQLREWIRMRPICES